MRVSAKRVPLPLLDGASALSRSDYFWGFSTGPSSCSAGGETFAGTLETGVAWTGSVREKMVGRGLAAGVAVGLVLGEFAVYVTVV